eukprot:3929299-Alexandrium_andersonii.AAC.1
MSLPESAMAAWAATKGHRRFQQFLAAAPRTSPNRRLWFCAGNPEFHTLRRCLRAGAVSYTHLRAHETSAHL